MSKKEKAQKKLWSILGLLFLSSIITYVYFLVSNNNNSLSVDQLSIWITAYSAVVTIFSIIAFLNIYTSKSEYEKIVNSIEEKNKELNDLSIELTSKVDSYELLIDYNTKFIFDYLEYANLSVDNCHTLLDKFQNYMKQDKNKNLANDIVLSICNFTINYELSSKEGTVRLDILDIYIDNIISKLESNQDNDNQYLIAEHVTNLTDFISTHLKEDRVSYDTEERLKKLKLLKEQLAKCWGFDNYQSSNIVAAVDSHLMVYLSFLEEITDLQIHYGYFGFEIYAKELIALLNVMKDLVIIQDLMPFHSKESIDKSIARIYDKYYKQKATLT